MKELGQKDLVTTMARKYTNETLMCLSHIFGRPSSILPEADEKDRLEQLKPLIVEFCKTVCPEMDSTHEAIEKIVQHHLVEIKYAIDSELRRYYGRNNFKAEPANQIFLDAPKRMTTLSAINEWSSTCEAPPSLKNLSHKALMNGIRHSVVGAKASAAFCCGGSVAFYAASREKQSTYQAESAPVTLRWDDQQIGNGKIVFSQASSADPVFSKNLEQLCRASQPASFGRGGESVFDGRRRPVLQQRRDSVSIAT